MAETIVAISAIVSALAAMGAVVISLLAFLASRKNGRKIEEVHVSINSRMDQLLAATGEASMAAGVVRGRAEGQTQDSPVKVDIVSIPPLG